MTVRFQIDYTTRWGQVLYISGSDNALGNFDERKARPMSYDGVGQWELEVEINHHHTPAYRYFVKDENTNTVLCEFGEARQLAVESIPTLLVCSRDTWRDTRHHENALYTSPFRNAFFKRKNTYRKRRQAPAPFVRFQLRAPRIGQSYSFGILGSNSHMGNWQESKLHLMADDDFPVWSVDVPFASDTAPFEYKYVIYSHRHKKIVTWESRRNRYFPAHDISPEKTVVQTDEYFGYPVGNWKAAGVAIPVFSLKTTRSAGVGEFEDIKPLVDWSVQTGIKIIQILPVNDTIATHTWVDSYPYAAISVHALHPVYANMEATGRLGDEELQRNLDRRARELNRSDTVDYEEVMRLKSEFFHRSFMEHKSQCLSGQSFQLFFEKNKHWLIPYACFSYLRDKYRTADFSQWGEYATIDAEKLERLSSSEAEHYDDIAVHYYIQYHLDRQLKGASEYARSRGVVLKGDIPIGIYRNSVDAWMSPDFYHMDCQAGAPPDDFSASGQNWGFPTYNWNRMQQDGFAWWKNRLVKMSEYFDVFRIDHILGFFRIWEIPRRHVEGVMGRFNPALPVHVEEFPQWGIHFDKERLCTPYIRTHMVYQIFGNHAHTIFDTYLHEYRQGCYRLRDFVDSQRKVKEHFDWKLTQEGEHTDFLNWVRSNLYGLLSEMLFLEAPLSDGQAWNPRIAYHTTYSYRELDDYTKDKLNRLYDHFFYRRHNGFWREHAMRRISALKNATDMLIGGEDLGMVPASVPGVLGELGILSLAIQRMPNDDREFLHPADNPYLSICSTGTHDMSTLREWWQEDTDATQRFYARILGHKGGSPFFCEPWVAADVIRQHMHSPSMLAIFPMQDLLAMDNRLRRVLPEDERINVPAIAQHYWRYRLHINIEQLIEEEDFNAMLRKMIEQSGRMSDY